MDWDKLRIFKAVADAGSFTRGGEYLNLSQSAVSRQINSLEKEIGSVLFHRHARGLILTEQGEMLIKTTREIFHSLEHVQNQLHDSKALAVGPLSITTVAFLASTWLVPQMKSFKKLYPNIQLTFLTDDRVLDLNLREADVALRLRRSQHNDLIERYMTTINFSVCASKSYLEEYGRPETPEDLANHTLIAYPDNTHTPFQHPNWALLELGVDLKNPNIMLINSMHTRYNAVRDGVAICVLPNYLIDQNPDIEVLFHDLEIPSADLFFVYPQERRNSQRINVLRDYLLEAINNTRHAKIA